MNGRGWRAATETELDTLAGITERDKQRAREAARIDGSAKLRALLESEPVQPKKRGKK